MSSVTAVPLQPVKTRYKVWLWLGILAAVALAFGLAWMGTRAAVAQRYTADQFLAWHQGQSGVKTTQSGLQYKIVKAGEGPSAVDQDGVMLEIHGELRDGTEFQPKAPMQLQIGQQSMIPGFVEAVKLMNKGAKYRVWLPPKLGYGAAGGQPNELADKVLIFDIEMKEHITAAQIQQMQMQQQLQQQLQGGGAPGAGGPPPQVMPGQ